MIIEWIQEQADLHPGAIAIKTSSEEYTYQALLRLIKASAAQIYDRKPTKNGTVALYFPDNRFEFLVCFLAASSIGWKAVPIDPKLPIEKVKLLLQDSNTDILITDKTLETICSWWTGERILVDSELNKTAGAVSLPKGTADSIFYIGYTSGTSGNPKGFVRTQHSWTESFRNTAKEYKINVGDQVIITGSLVHSLFLYGALHALSVGATVNILEKFSSKAVVERINQEDKIIIYVVPTMLETLLNEPYPQWKDIDLIISSGSKWNAERRKWIEATFKKAACIEFYGASELSFVSILHPEDASEKADSVGRPFTGVEVSIRDEAFREMTVGEVGTLYVKSNMVFKEYQNLPDETERVFEDEWVTAGDLARVDKDGYIYLVGRANQMIISGGLNIYPEEVEKVLQAVPSVEECAVIGIPDTYWGEKAVALIKWRNGYPKDEEHLTSVCTLHLPKYKCPKEYVTVDQFPYTVSRKVARNQLVELYTQRSANHE